MSAAIDAPRVPGDWRIGAVLVLIAKHGLPLVAALAAAGFLTWKLAGSFERRIDAVGAQLVEHNGAMEQAETERRANEAVQRALLRGICYGVNKTTEARAFCEAGR